MKAVISNRIYIEIDNKLGKELRDKLTYRVPTYGDGPPMIVHNYRAFRSNVLSIPAGRADLIPDDYEIVDKRILKPLEFPDFNGKLRESQQDIHDSVDDNCLINAKVGWGKTFMALALARKLGQKTIVVVHTLPLMYQWAEEVEKVFGFKPSLIGGGHDASNMPITIGNVASLYKRMDKLGKEFGTLIMDEVHHAPSPTFTRIIDCCFARYKIGLSGTLQRKDGLHVLLPDYFGYKVYTPAIENTMVPTIHAYHTGILLPYGDIWAHRVNDLNSTPEYQLCVVDKILEYEKAGHKVLFLADRVDFLKFVARCSGAGIIIGETEERKEEFAKLDRGEINSLCGTTAIFKEGISYNPFSCVILGSPINNEPMLEQIIGRIQRLYPDKLPPVVVDLILQGRTGENQFNNRQGFYMKAGFKIKYL